MGSGNNRLVRLLLGFCCPWGWGRRWIGARGSCWFKKGREEARSLGPESSAAVEVSARRGWPWGWGRNHDDGQSSAVSLFLQPLD